MFEKISTAWAETCHMQQPSTVKNSFKANQHCLKYLNLRRLFTRYVLLLYYPTEQTYKLLGSITPHIEWKQYYKWEVYLNLSFCHLTASFHFMQHPPPPPPPRAGELSDFSGLYKPRARLNKCFDIFRFRTHFPIFAISSWARHTVYAERFKVNNMSSGGGWLILALTTSDVVDQSYQIFEWKRPKRPDGTWQTHWRKWKEKQANY